MDRDELRATGKRLMDEGAELAKDALAVPAGRHRREAIAEAASHFMCAMGMAAMMHDHTFAERGDD